MFELKIKTHFAAAHQLRIMKSKCENLHGHNWHIEVCVAGKNLDETGLLLDFGILKKHLAAIIEKLDHKFLNEIEYFNGNPTSENVAKYIAEKLEESLEYPELFVSRVTAWESEDACVTYYPKGNIFNQENYI